MCESSLKSSSWRAKVVAKPTKQMQMFSAKFHIFCLNFDRKQQKPKDIIFHSQSDLPNSNQTTFNDEFSSSWNMKSNSNCSNWKLFPASDSGVWKLSHGLKIFYKPQIDFV